jgi:hypothetical protein
MVEAAATKARDEEIKQQRVTQILKLCKIMFIK